jgi:DNA-binding transcriptional LysR family regulator
LSRVHVDDAFGPFDLNLLIVFDAVMQERSVTRARSHIGLSQPEMNCALNRLRYMLKDDLFVRPPDGMAPPPCAETLAQPLRNALNSSDVIGLHDHQLHRVPPFSQL